MKMQVKAKILVSQFLDELTRYINEHIEKGWRLQGAVVPVTKDGVTSFLATMVLEV